jgi:hypothetical protein
MEGRALRARAAYRSWPREHIEFALVRPIRCAANIAMANRVIHDVMPLLCVGFGSTQLPIPKITSSMVEAETYLVRRINGCDLA